jgi:glycosyltransferase involved in cell wall biosynthesis
MSSLFKPIKIVDIDLQNLHRWQESVTGYESTQILVRLDGEPLGYITLPANFHQDLDSVINETILERYGAVITNHLLRRGVSSAELTPSDIHDLIHSEQPSRKQTTLPVTVAVCTRDRTADLARCLNSLTALDYPNLDILVIDNAPSNDTTQHLVRSNYPTVRYARELKPGLNWARNRAIQEAMGEIIAYTDDDVVVDSQWVKALADIFSENDSVMAVTGLVAPDELETEAQALFESYGGFGRGFTRRWYGVDASNTGRIPSFYCGAGMFGTGANMAYRRSVFQQMGAFDTALDVGTVTNGGGDLEMFFRILKEGHMLVYEPKAIVFHRHRRDYAQLRTQLTNNGIGFYSYLVRSARAYPEERFSIIRFGIWWLWWWNIRRLLLSFKDPGEFPRDLILAELRGSFIGLFRYQKSRRIAKKIAQVHAAGKLA